MSKPEDKTPSKEAETPDSLLNVGGEPSAELTEGQLDNVAGGFLKTPLKYDLKI
jgi:hypothetical protein